MFLFTFLLSLLSWVSAPNTALDASPANLYISTDKGQSWEGFAQGLPKDVVVRDVLEHNGTIYLTAYNHGFYLLEKGSKTWVKRSTGLPVTDQFTSVPLGELANREFFPISLAVEGEHLVIGTFDKGIYFSTNAGIAWQQATTNIDDVVGSLLFTDDLLLAGTHRGIWQSKDKGNNWELRCETGYRINALTEHNGQLHIASQNGMGVLSGNDIEWADMHTNWAIIRLHSEGDHLYAITAKQEVYRTQTGRVWEDNRFAIKGLPFENLIEALWGGYAPTLPNELPAGLVTKTSRGWIVGVGGGC